MGCLHIILVPENGDKLPVSVRLSAGYKWDKEDGAVYSDAEEPFAVSLREEFPNIQKVTKQPEPIDQPEATRTLKKIASLVTEQASALKEAEVVVPSSSKEQPHSKVKGALPTHEVPELPEGTLDCPLCGKSYPSRSKLKDHYVVHTYKSKWVCLTCEVPFTTKIGHENHQKLHTKFKCTKAHGQGRNFNCQSYYNTLQEVIDHMNLDPAYAAIDDNRKCDLCARVFLNRPEMLKHRKHRCFHNPEIEIEYFYCTYCATRYGEKKYVTQHERYHCPKGPKLPHPGKKRKAGEKEEEKDD